VLAIFSTWSHAVPAVSSTWCQSARQRPPRCWTRCRDGRRSPGPAPCSSSARRPRTCAHTAVFYTLLRMRDSVLLHTLLRMRGSVSLHTLLRMRGSVLLHTLLRMRGSVLLHTLLRMRGSVLLHTLLRMRGLNFRHIPDNGDVEPVLTVVVTPAGQPVCGEYRLALHRARALALSQEQSGHSPVYVQCTSFSGKFVQ
jgi:hypothetical protein